MMDPINNETDAYKAMLLPSRYNDRVINNLLNRGYNTWVDDGEADKEQMLTDIGNFCEFAVDPNFELDEKPTPFVPDPGTLIVMSTNAAFIVDNHDVFEDVRPRNNQIIANLKSLAEEILIDQLKNTTDFPLQRFAEEIYDKDQKQERMHAGRTVTDVVPEPPNGHDKPVETRAWIEIPLPAAPKKALVSAGDTYRAERDDDKELISVLQDNSLYVPLTDLYDHFRELWEEAFDWLLSHLDTLLSGDQKVFLCEEDDIICDRIERLDRAQHTEDLYLNYDPEAERLKVLVKAVKSARDQAAQLGDELTAKEIYGALQAYEPSEHEERQYNSFKNPRSTAQFLSSQADSDNVEKVEGVEKNSYILHKMRSSTKPIEIHEVEDLFEFPCFQALDERFEEKGPSRKELFSLVRYIWWLPQYRDMSRKEFIEEMKDLFSRWPWYDESTTEYQVDYELDREMSDGKPPLPIGCNNDDMQVYCVGKDECPYSLYGSVEFPPDVYQRVEEHNK